MFKFLKTNESTPQHLIVLQNSIGNKKEVFEPLKKEVVTIYACGPTVYDHIHIGNLRAYLLPDLLHRLFLYNGYDVKLTINFTDFGHLTDDGDAGEDKMMNGLAREGLPITLDAMRSFADQYIYSFKTDNESFGNLPATNYTRASDYVTEQIKLIQTLTEKGYAYQTSDGVYFDIKKFPSYGKIGNVDIEKMKAGARVEVNTEKHHPADFALWKKGPLGWKSDWGVGFPGWHIECTAMAFSTLGKQIDIHTGGEDLKYTHHNGEIAQAECITGKQFVQYWLHNAHITMLNKKLSKSTGNGVRINDLVAKGYSPLDYRYWLLTSHYRTTSDFNFETLTSAQQALTRLKRIVYEDLEGVKTTRVNEHYETKFMHAMHDDLNTPQAISVLWDLAKDTNIDPGERLATFLAFDTLLGIGLSKSSEDGKAELGFITTDEVPADITELLDMREVARIAQNWPEADRLRGEIEHKGYTLKDTPEGQKLTKE